MSNTTKKLRENPVWKETYAIVEFIYSKVDEIVANNPDEKWATATKLRNSANDSMFYVSQAVGSAEANAREYDWNGARKNLFAVQTMYIFATKQKLLELEPEMVVRIDRLIESVDSELIKTKKDTEVKRKKEMEPWLEKYRIWQQMQDK